MPEPAGPTTTQPPLRAAARERPSPRQRPARTPALAGIPPAIGRVGLRTGEGEPLPAEVAARLQASLGVDVSSVRVHADTASAAAAQAVGARAFTIGNHIFLGRDERPTDLTLIAHEVAHVVQQHGATALQRWRDPDDDRYEREAHDAAAATDRQQPFRIRLRTSPTLQRLGVSDALEYFSDKVEHIPGFRLFTLILGVNPITMTRVERTAANILRALIEVMPGGRLITQALEKYRVFEQVGDWVTQQVRTLKMTGSVIRKAIDRFLDSLSWRDIFDLGDVWRRAKRIFTDPIDHLFSFARSLVSGIVSLVKRAVLRPLASLARGTRGYDLLRAVLGYDPITGESVPRNAETLIGGFMKLIGREDIWRNLQRAKAVPRAWAWFHKSVKGLLKFVRQVPGLVVHAVRSLELSDILVLPRAFKKIGRVFLGFAGRFVSWAGGQTLTLLRIIFQVVAPAVMPYLRRAVGAFGFIIRNPVRFIRRLVRAGRLGFRRFAARFISHLRTSLVQWLTGTMRGTGVHIPQALNAKEIIAFVVSVLGLTWRTIRTKLVRAVGERTVTVLETTFEFVVRLVREGPAAAWEIIQRQIDNLREMVMGQIMTFVRSRIVQAAVTKLVTSLNPAGAFIQAIIAIYNTIMFVVERLRQIARVGAAFVNSLSAIARGAIGGAANRVEQVMAGMLTLVISFLSRLAGLGNVSSVVANIVQRLRAPIDRALDRLVNWIRNRARVLLARRVGADSGSRLRRALASAQRMLDRFAGRAIGRAVLRPLLASVRLRYRLTSLEPVDADGYWAVEGVANPRRRGPRSRARVEDGRVAGIDPEPTPMIDFGTNEIVVQFAVLSRRFIMKHSLQRHHYRFLSEGEVKPQNSIMHHNLAVDATKRDAYLLAANIQGMLRRNIRRIGRARIEGRYAVSGRRYVVDSPTHFFVVSGAQVLGGVTRQQWIAARLLRLIEQTAIRPDEIRRMVTAEAARRLVEQGARPEDFVPRRPLVNSAARAIHKSGEYVALAVVSGRSDLVRAFQDLNRLDGRT